jgi:hypothetical protein
MRLTLLSRLVIKSGLRKKAKLKANLHKESQGNYINTLTLRESVITEVARNLELIQKAMYIRHFL